MFTFTCTCQLPVISHSFLCVNLQELTGNRNLKKKHFLAYEKQQYINRVFMVFS